MKIVNIKEMIHPQTAVVQNALDFHSFIFKIKMIDEMKSVPPLNTPKLSKGSKFHQNFKKFIHDKSKPFESSGLIQVF